MVQEKQGVPRLGGVGEQLVTPLPGDHSDLVRDLSVRAEGIGRPGPAALALCARWESEGGDPASPELGGGFRSKCGGGPGSSLHQGGAGARAGTAGDRVRHLRPGVTEQKLGAGGRKAACDWQNSHRHH